MLLLLLCLVTSVLAVDHVLVDTMDGPVQGDVLTLHSGHKINTFLGIPYAEPPVGDMRWMPPESVDPWRQPFIANQHGAACTQSPINVIILTNPDWSKYSEDCLTINVYAPNATSDERYPVLVWFYGGAFTQGANVQYPGHFLAAKGVIVVVPNYRLNIMGFLTTADPAARGNYGMLDQVHALKWVQRNIHTFGGDPGRVTIAGESAGAASTGLQLLSSLSRGLFHGAFLASGSEVSDWVVQGPEVHPENAAFYLAEQHDCPTDNTFTMIDCLRDVEPVALRISLFNCSDEVCGLYGGEAPTVDGLFLKDMPKRLREAGDFAKVPEVTGINREESSIAFPFWLPDTEVTRAEFEAAVIDFIDTNVEFATPELREDFMETLIWYYAPWPHIDDVNANNQQLIMMTTDATFGFDNDYSAKMHMRGPATTYQYLFSYMSDNHTFPDWMGCPHTMELPYFWGYPLLTLNDEVRNQSGIVDYFGYTALDIAYAEYWMTLVTNFVKTGDPTKEPVPSPIGGPATVWEPSTVDNLYYLYAGNDYIEQREDYRQQEYALWHSYLNTMLTGEDWPFPYSETNMGERRKQKRSKYVKAILEHHFTAAIAGVLEEDEY